MDFNNSTPSDFSLDITTVTSGSPNSNSNTKSFVIVLILILIILFFFYNKKSLEHMTAGTLTQLFATDAQNKSLNGNTDYSATGDFNLYWNQPTRVASTYPNRGQLLPATIIAQVAAEQNGNDPNNLDINLNRDLTYSDSLNKKAEKLKNYLDNSENKSNSNNNFLQQNCGENCYTNPQACGNGAGGYRLGSGFVEPTTAKPFVSLQGNVYLPDSYVGQYWIAPKPDIMKPLPVVADGLYPLVGQLNNS